MPAEPAKDKPLHPKRAAHPRASRPRARDKDLNRLVKLAWKAGWWCVQGGKYIHCYPPDDGRPVFVVSTPSSQARYRNTRALFRDRGLDV